jgi:2-dehydro-3-deoxyphosphogluconate aldolase/(4S)-4-hydroxy-2-oxoglutarate aldolase
MVNVGADLRAANRHKKKEKIMQDKATQIDILLNSGLVAIARLDNINGFNDKVKALRDGGCKFVEITMNTPDALKAIEAAAGIEGVVIGAGTVLDPETARCAILAGSQFIVTPIMSVATIEMCSRYSVISMPGAFTPTEIFAAWNAGADFVKVFPATIGGAAYIKAVRGPLPQIRMLAVGGVNLENTKDFMAAGACGIGVGNSLIGGNDLTAITRKTQAYLKELEK